MAKRTAVKKRPQIPKSAIVPAKPAAPAPRSASSSDRRVAAARRAVADVQAGKTRKPAKKASKVPKAATRPVAGGVRIRVRALKMGYYDHKRRREGDVFTVREQDFSDKWMEPVLARTPSRITTGKQALDRLRMKKRAKMAAALEAREAGEDVELDDEFVVTEDNDPDYHEDDDEDLDDDDRDPDDDVI